MFDFYEIVGLIGTFLYLLSYAILQHNREFSHHVSYWFINLIATSCLIFSLYFHWNVAAFIGNLTWFIISLVGVLRSINTPNTVINKDS